MICIPLEEDLEALAKDPKCPGPLEDIHKTAEAKKKSSKKGRSSNSKADAKPIEYNLSTLELSHVVDTSSRQIVGFVTSGDFILSQGHNGAVGYVAIQGLLELLKKTPSKELPLALVRDNKSLQYRFAHLSVHVPL
jgi:hypothetical protein